MENSLVLKVREISLESEPTCLSTSHRGLLAVGTVDGVYVFDRRLNKINFTAMPNKVVALDATDLAMVALDDEGWVAFMSYAGEKLKEAQIDPSYDNSIVALDDGFIACGIGCARFHLKGRKGFQRRWHLGLNLTASAVKLRSSIVVALPMVGALATVSQSGRLIWLEPFETVKFVSPGSMFGLYASNGDVLSFFSFGDHEVPKPLWMAELRSQLNNSPHELLDARYDGLVALATSEGVYAYSRDDGLIKLCDCPDVKDGKFFGSDLVLIRDKKLIVLKMKHADITLVPKTENKVNEGEGE